MSITLFVGLPVALYGSVPSLMPVVELPRALEADPQNLPKGLETAEDASLEPQKAATVERRQCCLSDFLSNVNLTAGPFKTLAELLEAGREAKELAPLYDPQSRLSPSQLLELVVR